jgi:lipopolysaccharide transport system permease protein
MVDAPNHTLVSPVPEIFSESPSRYYDRLATLPFRDPAPPRYLLESLSRVVERRFLLYQFVRRELSLRYKQTLLGIGWALFQPLSAMVLFTIVFGRFLNVDSEGAPYAVFVLSGLVPWTFFSAGLINGSQTVVAASGIIGKVPFPPELLPISGVLVACVDFLISGTILFVMLVLTGRPISFWYFLLPVLTLLQIALTLSLAFIFSALNVQYRDVRYVLPFLMPLLMYAMPIGYSFDAIPAEWRMPVVILNPMAALIDSYRKILLSGVSPRWHYLGLATAEILLLLWAGYKFFKNRERAFADVI